MKKNIHDFERIGRVVGGVLLSSLGFWGPKRKIFLGFLVPVAEGIVGKCLLYSALNMSTRREQSVEEQANQYMHSETPAEAVAGHPIVGVA